MTRLVTLMFILLDWLGRGGSSSIPADSNNEQLQALVNQTDAIFYGEEKKFCTVFPSLAREALSKGCHIRLFDIRCSIVRGSVDLKVILRTAGTDGKGGIMMQNNVPTFRKWANRIMY